MSSPAAITVVSPINIAFIKYWGKTDEELIIPTNDSFSITLSTKKFRTRTSVAASRDYADDGLWLNGKKVEFGKSGRLYNVLKAARERLPPERRDLKVRVVSENNFPTAAGMASSAAGLSALAFALTQLLRVPGDVSTLARIGSGSACRSVYGGLVKWLRGSGDGPDCVAQQFVDHKYWPELQVLCLVVKAEEKDTPSTVGMKRSVETSPAMAARVSTRVPDRMARVSDAIKARDFPTFAQITMDDFEDFREVCATTQPPINYWTDRSREIIALVNAFNGHHGGLRAAYTFDAGPNAFIFTLRSDLSALLAYLLHHFPTPTDRLFLEDESLLAAAQSAEIPEQLKQAVPGRAPSALDLVLHSPVGDGPHVLDGEEPLVDPSTGSPAVHVP
eukprot:TRINITY_DN43873_c0_g1_i1.p1 TRINITY_DN43873_c0_g1~~TRINITY_DN43873_c0_g1_i1.p1  ORF type:complete len:409 (+),score=150.52 TRINITY_DN43873_c0_g1_i1:58-1227(+)